MFGNIFDVGAEAFELHFFSRVSCQGFSRLMLHLEVSRPLPGSTRCPDRKR